MVGMKKRVKRKMGTPKPMTAKNKKLAAMYGDKDTVTRGDVIAAATRKKAMGGGMMKKRVGKMGGGSMKKRVMKRGGGMMKKPMLKRGGKIKK